MFILGKKRPCNILLVSEHSGVPRTTMQSLAESFNETPIHSVPLVSPGLPVSPASCVPPIPCDISDCSTSGVPNIPADVSVSQATPASGVPNVPAA